MYKQKELERDLNANCGRSYQQCSISVMDTIADPNITFDDLGICNYYYEYLAAEKQSCLNGEAGRKKQEELAAKIKATPGKKGYNCILGLSGGADSTYLAYLAKDLGLNPLLVHFDYGWNTEIAVKNVENAVKSSPLFAFIEELSKSEFSNLSLLESP